jgi:hypothetical protein
VDAGGGVSAGEHPDPGEDLGLDQEDERPNAGAVDEVDGIAAVRQIEVVAGGLVAGDVVADLRAGVDVGQTGEVELVLAAGDGGDVGAVAEVGEVLAPQGDRPGRAEDQAGADKGGLAVAGNVEALGQSLGAADGVDVEDGDLDALGMQEPGDEEPSLLKPITRAGRPWRMSPRPRMTASVEKTTDWPTRKSSGSFSGDRATEMTGQGSLSRSS